MLEILPCSCSVLPTPNLHRTSHTFNVNVKYLARSSLFPALLRFLRASLSNISMEISQETEWIKLTNGKDYSRLLYPNPVCFLTTVAPPPTDDESSSLCSTMQITPDESKSSPTLLNVMVLSWLTATNNSGRFMFSINRRRHTASILVPQDHSTGKFLSGTEFVLSVPIKGMEQLTLDVGSISGRWGSKFPADYEDTGDDSAAVIPVDFTSMSNRKKKKRKKQQFAKGIAGLVSVPFGKELVAGPPSRALDERNGARNCGPNDCFAIHGTCAHLKCKTYAIVSEPPNIIDEDHHLVMAEVLSAYVSPQYWDSSKKLFRPNEAAGVPPFLKFFGSQQFN